MLLGQIDISRQKLIKAFYTAIGLYVEQEKTKKDDWTKERILDLFTHLKNEMQEIAPHMTKIHELIVTNKEEPVQDMACDLVWHCADLVGLSLMVLAKVMEKAGMMTKEVIL